MLGYGGFPFRSLESMEKKNPRTNLEPWYNEAVVGSREYPAESYKDGEQWLNVLNAGLSKNSCATHKFAFRTLLFVAAGSNREPEEFEETRKLPIAEILMGKLSER